MHLLLILLIPPAFGRPSISDIDSDSQFNSIVEFTHETGKLLNDSSVIDNVVKMLQAAEKNMIVMTSYQILQRLSFLTLDCRLKKRFLLP